MVIAPEEKINSTLVALETLLEMPRVSVRKLASVTGRIQSLARAFAPVQVKSLEFYKLIDAKYQWWSGWDEDIELSTSAMEDIHWLIKNLRSWNRRPAWKPSKIKTVYVDASLIGWCRVFQDLVVTGNWAKKLRANVIAQLEAMAVLRVLQSFGSLLEGSMIMLLLDNKVALRTEQKGGPMLWQKDIAQEIWNVCIEKDIEIFRTQWIPSESNLADEFSRIVDLGDWILKSEIVKQLEDRWGKFAKDRFASQLNAKMERFNSLHFCPGSEAVDCFSQDWKGAVIYLCPPFTMIHRAITHAKECGALIIIIVPVWVTAPWWPMIIEATREEIDLPPPNEIILPGPSGCLELCNNNQWRLRAIRIDWSICA